jgi:hypothetical protein
MEVSTLAIEADDAVLTRVVTAGISSSDGFSLGELASYARSVDGVSGGTRDRDESSRDTRASLDCGNGELDVARAPSGRGAKKSPRAVDVDGNTDSSGI